MGNNQNCPLYSLANIFKYLNQILEAPNINTSLWLIKDRELGASSQHSSNLNTLQLTAGQGVIYLAVNIFLGAQAHLGQIFTGTILGNILTSSQTQKVNNLNALEMHWLLKSKADSQLGTFRNILCCNILSVKKQTTRANMVNAHNCLGQSGFTATIWAGYYYEFAIWNHQIHMVNNIFLYVILCYCISNILQL